MIFPQDCKLLGYVKMETDEWIGIKVLTGVMGLFAAGDDSRFTESERYSSLIICTQICRCRVHYQETATFDFSDHLRHYLVVVLYFVHNHWLVSCFFDSSLDCGAYLLCIFITQCNEGCFGTFVLLDEFGEPLPCVTGEEQSVVGSDEIPSSVIESRTFSSSYSSEPVDRHILY